MFKISHLNLIKPTKSVILAMSIIFTLVYFASCERDDICVDGDTPLLVVGFYDIEDTTETKDVPGLEVRGLIAAGDTLEIIENAALDSIAIPLRPTQNSTSFLISQTFSDPDTTFTNMLTFTYEVRDEFISRACGFVANYNALEAMATVATEGDSLWMQDIRIETSFIENSAETHVKVFH